MPKGLSNAKRTLWSLAYRRKLSASVRVSAEAVKLDVDGMTRLCRVHGIFNARHGLFKLLYFAVLLIKKAHAASFFQC